MKANIGVAASGRIRLEVSVENAEESDLLQQFIKEMNGDQAQLVSITYSGTMANTPERMKLGS